MKAYFIFSVLVAIFLPIVVALSYFAALFGHPVYLWLWRDILGVIQ